MIDSVYDMIGLVIVGATYCVSMWMFPFNRRNKWMSKEMRVMLEQIIAFNKDHISILELQIHQFEDLLGAEEKQRVKDQNAYLDAVNGTGRR